MKALSALKEKEKEFYGSDAYKAHQAATTAVHQMDSKISRKEAIGNIKKSDGAMLQANNAAKQAIKATGRGMEGVKRHKISDNHLKVRKEMRGRFGENELKDISTLRGTEDISNRMRHVSKNATGEEKEEADNAIKAYDKAETMENFQKLVKDYGDESKQDKKATKMTEEAVKMSEDFEKLKTPKDYAAFSKANPVKK